ncbi:hypothetical protein [Chryseobacterium bernardetii]
MDRADEMKGFRIGNLDDKSVVEKTYFGLFGSIPEDHENDL